MLLIVISPSKSQTAPSAGVKQPEAVAVSFYKWYLGELATEKVPTDDLKGPIHAYLTAGLTKRLTSMLSGGDMESDYFLKAQDFLPDWKDNVKASPPIRHGTQASTTVTLGGNPDSIHRLSVKLVEVGGSWKIDSVDAAK